jgi:hypothetical protein
MDFMRVVEAHVASEESEMFRKTEAIMTPQEAEEFGVPLKLQRKLSAVTQRPPNGGTAEQISV